MITAYRVGDIDDDGRDEFYATTHESSPDVETTHLIPGTIAPGTYGVADAGISFGPGGSSYVGTPLVLLEDGSGRLLRILPTRPDPARTDVYDGATVLALGPGGDTTSLEPDQSSVGKAVAIADLGSPTDAIIALDFYAIFGPEEVTVLDEGRRHPPHHRT